ncbi:MAG: hypothetical protein AAB955_02365 [Patescibacteria group bacterium]
MEDRKSILETVKPSDALVRLGSRQSGFRMWAVVIAVLFLFGVVIVAASIFNSTGASNEPVPSVSI